MELIKEISVSTAKELWDLLSPENNLIPNVDKPLFRGQADSEWALNPSIFRVGKYPYELPEGYSLGDEFEIYSEYRVLHFFLESCDSAGIYLPGNNYLSRKELRLSLDRYQSNKDWPPTELYDLMSVAQHYGLPTRLLDWTRRSYVAAYFAASDALRLRSSKSLAIWVLNVNPIMEFDEVDVFTVPAGVNKNIAAQTGVFTVLKNGKHRQPLNSYIQEKSVANCLVKLTLPISEAHFLLGFCRMYGVMGSTVYPDIYGAAKSAIDQINIEAALRRGI